MLLEPTAIPNFIASARCNVLQIDGSFGKLDDSPDPVFIAENHDVIPLSGIGRFLL